MTVAGLKLALAMLGEPSTPRVTAPLKPPTCDVDRRACAASLD
jgi:hypothetical protein